MNRETESHFAQIPQAEIGRSKFNRGFNHSTTGNVGDIMPLYVDATILPGDTVKMNTGALIRMLTPLTPVMGNMYADVMFFFVPHRLVWDNFKKFMGENDNVWAVTTEYHTPKMELRQTVGSQTTATVEKGSLLNYMGIPLGIGQMGGSADTSIKINNLPIRSYMKVWNDWFRDQNTQKEIYFGHGDSTVNFVSKTYYDSLTSTDKYATYLSSGPACAKAARNSDYFSRCLPEPQKGPTPLVPLVGEAPIVYGPSHRVDKSADEWNEIQYDQKVNMRFATVTSDIGASVITGNGTISDPYTDTVLLDGKTWGMYADLQEATGATVQAIRQAFAIQKFYERQARGGSRYIEVVQSHFNVTNPDFRLQRSEYLGGKRFPISINQVVQETPTATQELGFTGAYSVTSDVSEDIFTHSFTEHGTLLGVCVIRYQHSYQQGINAQWFMDGIFDFYWPELSNLGDTPVYNREIYAKDGSAANITQNNEVFGYQEAWAHYRYQPDMITGELSSMYSQSLDIWHWGDYYSTLPTLNAQWIMEDPTNVTRTLAYQTGDQFKIDMYFDAIYTRPMPLYTIPGLVDHH